MTTVAAKIGVSASLISQVETGKTLPSVSTLRALVTILGISFDDLISDAGPDTAVVPRPVPRSASASGGRPAPFAAVQRGVDNPVLQTQNGVRWERLATGTGGPVDPLLVTYEPGASSSIEGGVLLHTGAEYLYLLSGELTAHLDSDTFVVRPGDSLTFDSERPHTYVNNGSVPATGLWFAVRPRGVSGVVASAEVTGPARAEQLDSAVDIFQAVDKSS